jgi:hypothetical protein
VVKGIRRHKMRLGKAVIVLLLISSIIYFYSIIQNQNTEILDEYNQSVKKIFAKVEKRLSEIRGYKADVAVEVVTKEWVLRKWGSTSIDPESLTDEEVFYKSLLLVPSNFSFEERKNKEVGGFMAFYWEKKVYVVKENFDPNSESGEEALAHELEHVIQERYFKIKHDNTFDGDKAYAAIVEGDAVLAGWLYAEKDLKEEMENINRSVSCSSEPNKGYVRESNLNYLYFFPYKFGTLYIAKAYLKGGYEEVDKILRDPPTSTSEILHPENQHPMVDTRLDISFEYGYRVLKDTRMGEFFLYIFLSSHLNDCEAFKAASGWIGDHLKILRKGDEFIYYWRILFRGNSDAEEFQFFLEKMLEKIGKKEGKYWITGADYVEEKIRVNRTGNEVLIVGRGRI